ncbi:proline/betaine transporter, partial [Xanthomonas perforans]
MHDARAMRSHFGWFKRRRQLQLDDVTVVDRSMLR